MGKSVPTICLIDGSGYIFRAFYALPPMSRLDGTPTNAVYGFTSMMLNLLQENCCQQIVVVFDAKRQNFRHQIYPEYKANRHEIPPDLIPQFALIRSACDALNIQHIEKEGYEADDLIATLATIARKNNQPVRIISADKDLMQLMQSSVTLYDPMKKKELTLDDVQKKFGVSPDKVIEVQSLMGDSTDNVPGAKGVGPKTAATLINQFGSIENLYQNLDKITATKQRENLFNDKEKVFISKKLVSLDTNVPISNDLTIYQQKEIGLDKITAFLKENNFPSLMSRLPHHIATNTAHHIKTIILQNENEFETAIQALQKETDIAIYCQSESGTLIGIGLASQHQSYWYPIQKSNTLDLFQTQSTTISEHCISLLKSLFNLQKTKYLYDVKQTMHTLSALGIEITPPYHDIMLMSYILDGSKNDHQLDSINHIYNQTSITENNQAQCILELGQTLTQKLHQEKLWSIYADIDLPIIPILFEMEQNGFLVDPNTLKNLQKTLAEEILKLSKKIHQLTQSDFNINSPAQLGIELFEKRHLPGGKKGANGHWITDVKVLERLANDEHDELAQMLLEYRRLTKLQSTYVNDLLERYQNSPRIHTTFSMINTNTGRLASFNPNLQNIPIKSDLGKQLRSAFIARPGYTLVSADYSQIELRLIAHVAKVTKLQESFIKGEDIHARTASQILNIPLAEITPDQRRQAKAVNFGIIYGISAFGLARNLGISRTQANDYIQSYFHLYPEIKDYMKHEIDFAHQNQYVLTPYGRKIYINGLNQSTTKSFAERAAINAPIQGGAADIIKMSMIRVAKAIKNANIPAQPIMQIHDELIFEVPESDAKKLKELLIQHMQSVVQLSVPLVVEAGIGPNWQRAH